MKILELIDKNLEKFLPSEKADPRVLHRAMQYSTFPGGKRIRPVILIESAAACGGNAKKAVAAGCAVELIHTYSLIHDDLPSMDDDDYRRGKPSAHKKFGEAIAILAGDALATLAFNILAEEYPPETGIKMVKELATAIGSTGMAGGQALDIANGKDKVYINRLKTAKLFEAAAAMGAISALASNNKVEALRRYGLELGMAFQAFDDIADGHKSSSRKSAERSIAKAKHALKIFGNKADALKKIADSCG